MGDFGKCVLKLKVDECFVKMSLAFSWWESHFLPTADSSGHWKGLQCQGKGDSLLFWGKGGGLH